MDSGDWSYGNKHDQGNYSENQKTNESGLIFAQKNHQKKQDEENDQKRSRNYEQIEQVLAFFVFAIVTVVVGFELEVWARFPVLIDSG